MEPLFSAVICGCNAGLLREALHEVYIPRIQRGNASFAANVLGAREPLLSVLVSLRKTSSSSLWRRGYTWRPREGREYPRSEVVTSLPKPCVIRLINPSSCTWHS
jgi:hypothetical protein